jgi:N utilization substance protein A
MRSKTAAEQNGSEEMFAALEMLEKTKGIPMDYMFEKIEAALVSAYKKDTGEQNVRVSIDSDKKQIKLLVQKTVVETVENPTLEISLEDARKISRRIEIGNYCETEIEPKNFRRLSAQNGKQMLVQAIREAERSRLVSEYESKREEVITAIVTKTEGPGEAVVVDTGTSETVLLPTEQIPGETFEVGDRIKVFVTEVRRDDPKKEGARPRGPLVTLSRIHPGLVKRLFESEIPEIADGIVLVRGIAREAGSRTKIAVYSRDPDVDAVGACIGNRGMRINAIVDELRGEKIDIVEYSDDPREYIRSALSPATVIDVVLEGERSARVLVDPDQLSLAIGREGQNARLAAHLTGFKIDIKA